MIIVSTSSSKKDVSKGSLARLNTGISKLDEILQGGLPVGSIVLIAGGPGVGKTILAAQYVYLGATKMNEKGVYVTFCENADTFKRYMSTLNWDFAHLEETGKLKILDMVVVLGEGLEITLKHIIDEVRTFGATRLVIDSITALTLAMDKKIDARSSISILQRLLREMNCTTLMLTETPWGSHRLGSGVEEFIADGIILLETILEGTEFRRRLAVPKMRGTDLDMRYYRFSIQRGEGITIISYPETISHGS